MSKSGINSFESLKSSFHKLKLENQFPLLEQLCIDGDIENLKLLLNQKNKNICNESGESLLMISFRAKKTDIAQFFIQDALCDLDIQRKDGNSALHFACAYGNAYLTNILVRNGANTLIRNNNGYLAIDLSDDINIRNIIQSSPQFLEIRKRITKDDIELRRAKMLEAQTPIQEEEEIIVESEPNIFLTEEESKEDIISSISEDIVDEIVIESNLTQEIAKEFLNKINSEAINSVYALEIALYEILEEIITEEAKDFLKDRIAKRTERKEKKVNREKEIKKFAKDIIGEVTSESEKIYEDSLKSASNKDEFQESSKNTLSNSRLEEIAADLGCKFHENKPAINRSLATESRNNVRGRSLLHMAILENRFDLVQELVLGGAEINNLDSEKSTPLFMASLYGNVEIIKFLLNHGADPLQVNMLNQTVLHALASMPETEHNIQKSNDLVEIAKLFIDSGVLPSALDNFLGLNAYQYALKNGKTELSNFIFSKISETNHNVTGVLSPLNNFIFNSENEKVYDLVNNYHGHKLNNKKVEALKTVFGIENSEPRLILFGICNHSLLLQQGHENHDLERRKNLLKHYYKKFPDCPSDGSHFMDLIRQGEEITHEILAKQETFLKIVAAKDLLASGVKSNNIAIDYSSDKNKNLTTYLNQSCLRANFFVAQVILENLLSISQDPISSNLVQQTFNHQNSIDKATFLHYCCVFNKDDSGIAFLRNALSSPAKSAIELLDLEKTSPLIVAIRNGNYEITKLLLENGASPYINHDGKQYSLIAEIAIEPESIKFIHLLLDHGANPNHQNQDGITTLISACEYGDIGLVEKLLEKGANFLTKDPESGKKPQEIAREKGFDEIANLIGEKERIRREEIMNKILSKNNISDVTTQLPPYTTKTSYSKLEGTKEITKQL